MHSSPFINMKGRSSLIRCARESKVDRWVAWYFWAIYINEPYKGENPHWGPEIKVKLCSNFRFIERPSPSSLGPGLLPQQQQGFFSSFTPRPQRAITSVGAKDVTDDDLHQFPQAEFGGFVPVSDHTSQKQHPKVDDHNSVPRTQHETASHSKKTSRNNYQQPIANLLNTFVRRAAAKNTF